MSRSQVQVLVAAPSFNYLHKNCYTMRCLLIALLMSLFAQCSAGTLIVTYEILEEAENRLDRIRFLLTHENNHQEMYPKGKGFIEDPARRMRMVLVEDLPAGNYIFELLLPNKDGIYEELSPKHFVLEQGAVVKLDQLVKPK